jgi:hypothetical protein
MDEVVLVPIPVSPAAAAALVDAERRRRIGELVSAILRPEAPETDPLAALIAQIKAEARADGLTEEAIDAELAAYNAERRA